MIRMHMLQCGFTRYGSMRSAELTQELDGAEKNTQSNHSLIIKYAVVKT